jgi:hypothetical protein
MRRPTATLARGAAVLALWAGTAAAEPPSTDEIARICNEAEGPAHCGRLIEAEQLKRLPNLARRDGDTLILRLFPNGETRFQDRDTITGGRSYALFDYLSPLNAVLLWTTNDDATAFLLVQRTTGRQTPLPAQPAVSPDRARLATADFCAEHCENLLVVWAVDRDGVRRDLAWKPAERWADASVEWKDADTLAIEYTREGESSARKLERRLRDAGWTRAVPPR